MTCPVRPLSNDKTCNGCRDARSSVRCVKGYGVRCINDSGLHVPFNGDGRTTVRPYISLHVKWVTSLSY